jgi:hypothetical protein
VNDDLKEAAKQVEVCFSSFFLFLSLISVSFLLSPSAKLTVGWDEIQD